jgi:hypothetical protein
MADGFRGGGCRQPDELAWREVLAKANRAEPGSGVRGARVPNFLPPSATPSAALSLSHRRRRRCRHRWTQTRAARNSRLLTLETVALDLCKRPSAIWSLRHPSSPLYPTPISTQSRRFASQPAHDDQVMHQSIHCCGHGLSRRTRG